MAHIVYAWELGIGFGHLTLIRPIAAALKERGHRVSFVVRNLPNAIQILGHDAELHQAPLLPPPMGQPMQMTRYPELLLANGFDDERQLLGMTQAWRRLFQLLRPDAVLFDHAPTALLAARTLTCKRATLGHGFLIPPDTNPMPAFWPWGLQDPERSTAIEAKVLANCNGVLKKFDAAPMPALMNLGDVDQKFLTTWPELDHYPERRGATYYGPQAPADEGAEPDWPDVGQGSKQVFAYLRNDYPGAEAVLESFLASGHSFLIFMPQMPTAWMAKHPTKKMRFTTSIVNLIKVGEQADLMVSHGGIGLVGAALGFGVPILVLPMQMEQYLISLRVEQIGAGILLRTGRTADIYRDALERVLGEMGFRQAAGRFSEKYRNLGARGHVRPIVDRIGELVET